MPTLVCASANPHKVREFSEVLQPLGWRVLSITEAVPDLPAEEPAETGRTFEENARLKAQYYRQFTDLPLVADDSGTEVVALNNRPGVNSKRFVPGSDDDRNQEVLRRLAGQTDRTARYVGVLCLLLPDGQQQLFTGEVKGAITDQPRGSAGFGYDPIFQPDGYQQTFAELGNEIKNQISHRARALQQLAEYLKNN